MQTHFNEFQLRKRGWTDKNLHLVNDLWQQVNHRGNPTWMVPILDVLHLEKTREFLVGLPGCAVKGEFER